MQASVVANELISLYRAHGDHRYGEDVTQAQHALQCMAWAEREGEPEVVILAAFLHDVGHLVAADRRAADELGSRTHEHVGATFLRALNVPELLVAVVAMHVEAKRYLCTVESGYVSGLSEASAHTLRLQGGLLTAPEVEAFRTRPHWEASVRVRRYDDRGKDSCLELAGLEEVEARLGRLLSS